MQRILKLVNHPTDCVSEAVEGMLLSTSHLCALHSQDSVIGVVHRDITSIRDKQVTIISGGGSGHEPAHAGYIGDGMLSGAVLGKVFASPSVSAILSAIRVCAGSRGVLLIIKNYTGDRLNFGMAAERAKSEGIDVEMVVVDDDCALPEGKGITGGRGVAGTVFVHKVAGATAKCGGSLAEVRDAAERTARQVKSLGAALTVCTVPGCPPSNRLDERSIEMCIGIHAEPGQVEEVGEDAPLSSYVSRTLLNNLLGHGDTPGRLKVLPEAELAVMVNNLGGTSELEMLVFTRDIMNILNSRGFKPVRCYVGTFMSSLEMAGVSVSLLPTDSYLLELLDAPTTATGWRRSAIMGQTGPTEDRIILSAPISRQTEDIRGGGVCKGAEAILRGICASLIENEAILTEYDSKCGDGDCGQTVRRAAEHLLTLAHEQQLCWEDSARLCAQLADGVSEAMGGTSGAIMEIMFRAMAAKFRGSSTGPEQESSLQDWAVAFTAGTEAIIKYGGAEEGMRTLLDALCPAVRCLCEGSRGDLAADTLIKARDAAQVGMERTKDMTSSAGRANYVSIESLRGTPDPGAYAVYLAFASACSAK